MNDKLYPSRSKDMETWIESEFKNLDTTIDIRKIRYGRYKGKSFKSIYHGDYTYLKFLVDTTRPDLNKALHTFWATYRNESPNIDKAREFGFYEFPIVRVVNDETEDYSIELRRRCINYIRDKYNLLEGKYRTKYLSLVNDDMPETDRRRIYMTIYDEMINDGFNPREIKDYGMIYKTLEYKRVAHEFGYS